MFLLVETQSLESDFLEKFRRCFMNAYFPYYRRQESRKIGDFISCRIVLIAILCIFHIIVAGMCDSIITSNRKGNSMSNLSVNAIRFLGY